MNPITQAYIDQISSRERFSTIREGLMAGEYASVLTGAGKYNPYAGASSFANSGPFDQEPGYVIVVFHAIAQQGLIHPALLSTALNQVERTKATLPLLLDYIASYLDYEVANSLLILEPDPLLESLKMHPDFVESALVKHILARIDKRLETRVASITHKRSPKPKILKALVVNFEYGLRRTQLFFTRCKKKIVAWVTAITKQKASVGEAPTTISKPTEAPGSFSAGSLTPKRKVEHPDEAITILILQLIAVMPTCRGVYGLQQMVNYSLGLFPRISDIVKALCQQGYLTQKPDSSIYTVTSAGAEKLNQIDMASVIQYFQDDVKNMPLLSKICRIPH